MGDIAILCVDDEKNVLRSLERIFFDEDYTILTADSGKEGLEILGKEQCQVVISDYRMPEMNGVDFLRDVCNKWPDTVRIVLSGYADVASIVSAINEGEIYKFIPKPWNDDELKVTIANAIERYNLHRENKKLTGELLDNNKKLEELNKNLEKRVGEKAADLLIQNRALRISQEILNIVPIGIVGVDNSGTVVQINNYAKKLLNKDNTGMLGEQADLFLCEHTTKLMEAASEQGKATSNSDGYDFIGAVVCVPLFQEGEQTGHIIVFQPDHS